MNTLTITPMPPKVAISPIVLPVASLAVSSTGAAYQRPSHDVRAAEARPAPAAERSRRGREGEPCEREGAASGRTKEGGAERGEQLPDPAFALGEARAYAAGVKAVGAELGGAPGELAREEDVAQLRGAIHAH